MTSLLLHQDMELHPEYKALLPQESTPNYSPSALPRFQITCACSLLPDWNADCIEASILDLLEVCKSCPSVPLFMISDVLSFDSSSSRVA